MIEDRYSPFTYPRNYQNLMILPITHPGIFTTQAGIFYRDFKEKEIEGPIISNLKVTATNMTNQIFDVDYCFTSYYLNFSDC